MTSIHSILHDTTPTPAPHPTPPHLLTARLTFAFRAALDALDLPHYQLFCADDLDLHDVDDALPHLGDPAPAWQPLPNTPPLSFSTHDRHRDSTAFHPAGLLHVPRHRTAVARWFNLDAEGYGVDKLYLAAAPCAAAFHDFRREILRLRRTRTASTWTVIAGHPGDDKPAFPRRPSTSPDLFLSDSLRQRLDLDISRFFSPDVAQLYASLRVPHRRGVLLHGPPGNGKTSLIRHIGAILPRVAGLILRPQTHFDSDALETSLTRWRDLAPAILVIEDLDWLLEQINVSTFLNLLDGLDAPDAPSPRSTFDVGRSMFDVPPSPGTPGEGRGEGSSQRPGDSARGSDLPHRSSLATGHTQLATTGLLLIATTNHPEKLDPALNNRPGRFDLTIEIPNPDDSLRTRFFTHHLPTLPTPTLSQLVDLTRRLSFAHLHEILRLSGLHAIHHARPTRTPDDILSAARSVRDSSEAANKGFPQPLDIPFGLASLRTRQPADTP